MPVIIIYLYLYTCHIISLLLDVFEEYLSPAMAAQTLLHNSAGKRQQVLNNTVEFCMQVLTGQKGAVTGRQKDGILHMLGALSTILLKV